MSKAFQNRAIMELLLYVGDSPFGHYPYCTAMYQSDKCTMTFTNKYLCCTHSSGPLPLLLASRKIQVFTPA